jgi:hypothetical protein
MPQEADPCAAWQEDLSALIDVELTPARRAEVQAHLAGCPRCRARLAELRRVDTLLAATPLPELPEDLAEKVVSRAADRRGRMSAPPGRRRWLAAPALGALAAAAALALYLALRPRPEAVSPAAPEPPVAVAPVRPRKAPPPEEHPPTLIAEPLLPPALPPPPKAEVPAFEPELAPPELALGEPELDSEPPEDLAVVLFGAERPDDFDVIANLEILERLMALDKERG